MNRISNPIGNHRPFIMEIEHRQVERLRILRGLGLLLGLLTLGGAENSFVFVMF